MISLRFQCLHIDPSKKKVLIGFDRHYLKSSNLILISHSLILSGLPVIRKLQVINESGLWTPLLGYGGAISAALQSQITLKWIYENRKLYDLPN
jgi:hypothetical protein